MSRTIRRRLAGIATVVASLSLAAGAQGASAQTLAGEHFQPAEHIEALGISGTCNADGPSTFSFHSFGPATGPVAGEYSTYGTFTLASPSGPVTAYGDEFFVSTDASDVYGTQSLGQSVEASCTPGQQENVAIEVTTAYDVLDPFAERGPGRVSMAAADGWAVAYSADFGAQAPPPPAGPTSREDCLNGGWADYPQFKNQGQCIAYVVRGARA